MAQQSILALYESLERLSREYIEAITEARRDNLQRMLDARFPVRLSSKENHDRH